MYCPYIIFVYLYRKVKVSIPDDIFKPTFELVDFELHKKYKAYRTRNRL